MGHHALQTLRLAAAALSAIAVWLPGIVCAQLLRESPAAERQEAVAGRLEAKRDSRPKVAIVIDDVGLNWERFEAANRLNFPTTLAFLPYGREAQQMVEITDPRHGVMLHMPMEPKTRKRDAGPDMVRVGPPVKVREAVAVNLAKLSGYRGVNNHTGSRITEDPAAMGHVLATLKARHLYFLDSKTSLRSVVPQVGHRLGAVVLEADLFLDGNFGRGGAEHVERQLNRLERLAIQKGEAIGIGHPYPSTLKALRRWAGTRHMTLRFVTTDQLAEEARAALSRKTHDDLNKEARFELGREPTAASMLKAGAGL